MNVTEAKQEVRFYASTLWQHLQSKNIFLWAQAIAFKALIAVIPLLILGTGLLGPTLARVVRGLFPPGQGADLIAFAERLQRASGTLTVVGLVGLLFTSVTLFTTLRSVLASVFTEQWHRPRAWYLGYLVDLKLTFQIGILFLLTLAISAVLHVLNAAGLELLQNLGLDRIWLESGWRTLIQLLGWILPPAITTVMFFQLYYYVPLPHPPWRSAVIGALFAAIMWEIAKFAFTLYAASLGGFDRYAAETDGAGLGGLGDAFGVVIAFVFWAYYSGLVMILGALVVLLHESRDRIERDAEPPDPADHSE